MKPFRWRLCACAVLAAPLCAQDVRLDVVVPQRTVYPGETLPVAVRVGYDAAFFRDHGIPLFQQQLDVPFQVELPWLAENRLFEAELAGPAGTVRVATGDRVVGWNAAPRDAEGRDRLELLLRVRPLAPGELTLPKVTVRYAYTSRYEEHFLRGRQPVDRQEGAEGHEARLTVAELPTAGRPAGFQGLIGGIAATASTTARELAVGEACTVDVVLSGDGNWRSAPPLPPPALPGFVVQGVVDGKGAEARTFHLDVLAVREGLTELPAFGLATFDPVAGRYVERTLGPLPLRVLPAKGPLEPRIEALVAADRAARARAAALPVWVWAAAAGGSLLVLAVLLRLRARAARRRQLEALCRELLAALPNGPGAAVPAWHTLLRAAGAPEDPAALPAWLAARGAAAVAEACGAVGGAIDGARYGGVLPVAAEVESAARAIVRAGG